MTEWLARPVLHVSSVNASLRFYVDRLGFTVPWRVEDENGHKDVAQVDRQGCALILAEHWPEKVGKGQDLDGNQLFFNYPNEPGQDPEGLRRR